MAIWFRSKSLRYAWLSNFSEHPFTIKGLRWLSVEHYYQAQKYHGTEHEQAIRSAPSPLKARKMGQNAALPLREDWEDAREAIMFEAVLAKFEQNRSLREKLVNTGSEDLVHESSTDMFWGRTLEGKGENRLGEMLIQVRSILVDESKSKGKPL